MWFYLALSSALFYSFRGILEKRIIHNVNKYILGLAIRLFALPFFFFPFLFDHSLLTPFLHLNGYFWLAIILISFIFTPLETIVYYEALKDEEITLVLPILTLAPALTVMFGLMLREVPTIYGILGVLSIVFGIYSLKLETAREGLLQPFHHLKNNRSVRLMFVVMLSQALSAVLDKLGITNSNAYVFLVVNYAGVSLTLFLIAFYKAKSHLGQLIQHFRAFSLIAMFVASYTLLYGVALQTGFAGYVIAIRNSYIIFTILFGIFYLKEKHIKQKLLAGALIFVGLVLLKAFG